MKHEKHDKAVAILKDCEARGLPIQSAIDFLMSKGMEFDQILEALDEASGGAVTSTATGFDLRR
jgi:hypothetical protein